MKKILVYITLFCLTINSNAQIDTCNSKSIVNPFLINYSIQRNQKRAIVDTNAYLSTHRNTFDIAIPLFTKLPSERNKNFLFRLNLALRHVNQPFQLSGISQRLHLQTSQIGIRAVIQDKQKLKGYVVFQANALKQYEDYAINESPIRFTGLAIYQRTQNKIFNWTVGLSLSYLFGEGRFFPILGSRIRLNDKNRLNIFLPFNISYLHYGKKMLFRFYTAPQGGFNNLNSQLSKYNPIKLVSIQRKELQIGVQGILKTDNFIQPSFYLGYTTRSKTILNTFIGPLDYTIENGLFIRLGLNFNLTKKESCIQDYYYSVIDEL